MRALLVDTETSGLVFGDGARVVEVAAALFDVKRASIIESFSCLIKHHENPAEHVNGIPVALLQEHGLAPEEVWERFIKLASGAECFVAHRAEFDRSFCCNSIESLGPVADDMYDPHKPWVCSKTDLQYPNGLTGESLVQLALGLGLGVASAHRAMTDVDTMARIFRRCAEIFPYIGEPVGWLEEQLRRGMRPKKRHVALVSFEQKDHAKRAGFLWDSSRREWYRFMPPEDAALLPFRVQERPI
jgi:DNA polymerase III subunit epsilon